MATSQEIRFRVLYVVLGVALVVATVLTLAYASSPWWALIPGVVCVGWWYTGIEAWVDRRLGHDQVGDAYRSGTQ